jgi:RecB family endonuclease NucS
MQPERWLEAELRAGIAELLPGLRQAICCTRRCRRFQEGDRGLLDLLTLDRNGRLAVIELKADEDLHLPLQALDYWIRVRALNDDRQPGRAAGAGAFGV